MKNKNLEEFIENWTEDEEASVKTAMRFTAAEILRVAEEKAQLVFFFNEETKGNESHLAIKVSDLKSYITKAKEAEAGE